MKFELLPVADGTFLRRDQNVKYTFEKSAKKLPEALAYFELNVELYPESWNVYDSLALAQMANGEKELAIANYKKSLWAEPEEHQRRRDAEEVAKPITLGWPQRATPTNVTSQ